MQNGTEKSEWSSNLGFIMACVGSAVGLGNIWKFPYITYQNGGGAFVLVYLLAILAVGLPIIMAEMMIGRHAKENVYATFRDLSKNSLFWKFLGVLCLFSAFVILSYYSVVAGWTVEYFWQSITGQFAGATPELATQRFGIFVGNGWKQILHHSIFMGLTGFIVWRGTAGIEKAVKILMPLLGLFVLIVASVSISKYGLSDSFHFMFSFDLSKLTPHGILEAVGHAFFTLSLGMGAMLIYGSYLKKGESLVQAGLWIVALDTLVALMACFMMYPIIFGTNMELKESASMLFTTLSVQFNQLPGGSFIGGLFYILVAFAALSSTISLLEPVVSFAMETFKIRRHSATLWSTLAIWLIGVGSALSNGASDLFTRLDVMTRFDYLASNWTLPVGGMLISIFCGFVLTKDEKLGELSERGKKIYPVWNFVIRYVSLVLVLIVILNRIVVFG